jgi:hypothetical protein
MTYSSTLKMEAVLFFATSVNFYGTCQKRTLFNNFNNYYEIPVMDVEGRFNLL